MNNFRWGRKQVLLWTAPITLTSWILVAISNTVFSLYLCRLMQGAVESLVLTAAPIYIAEISSSNIRGALEANIIFSSTLGVFYSYFIASYFSFTNCIYLSMILPILFFITFIFMPESPYYYLMIKNELEANKTLSWLRANDNINEEINEIKKTVDDDMNRKTGFKDLFATDSDCRIFAIVQLVNSAGIFCGIVSISELTEQTFNEVPLVWFTIDQISITIAVLLSFSSFIAIFFSDTIGRRILLIVSSIALTIANFIITLFYYLHEKTSINATSYIWLLYTGLFILCIFCNLGAFQLTRAIQAEFFPSHTRATGGALTGLLASLQLFIILKIYLPIKHLFGLYMNFLIYTLLNFIFTILMIKYIPESAGYLSVMTTTMCYYWISPFYSLFTKDTQTMTVNQFALLTAVTSIAETACCIPIATLADRFGRKNTLMLVGPISALLWIIAIFTKDLAFLFISRIVQGFLLGIIEVVASVYIAEISSPQWRGTLGGYYSVFNNIGLIYIYLNGGYFNIDNYLLSLIVIPILFTVTFIMMPESPYYYFMRNNRDKAIESLTWFRNNDSNIKNEALEIENAVREDMKHKANWKDLIATKSDRRALFIVLIVTVSRYMIGVGTFMAYGNSIFGKANQKYLTPNQLSIVACLLFAITAFLASFFSDIIGRRILLLASLYGSLFSNIALAIYFYILEKTVLTTDTYNWILYVGTIGFCIFTNIGLTQLMPTIKAEYFPSHTRSIGSAFATILSGIVVFLQMYTFPLIDEYFGMYLNFVSFAIFALLGLIFVMIYLTESAGKTLAEINVDIKNITEK
ncbi:hypothetical protein O3M35_007765 [Rhynocoris fuscipes]|uniref:Major facilitator superfamily (MFS) profile domain-containing protein n=1 Tax=Rhynocoris fuscipes TaxID=488301 RepID=A0AAW1DHU6_9HEMI